ncbi:MAG: helix-turn-helix domain-containing protein [Octadecabacter sp.]|nr:helix-turn-helix domain-containing protein [Octadecabacter sp.]
MLFSLSKAAKVAGVSKTTIHNWVKTGKLSASKGTDGTYSIDQSELDRVTFARKQVASTSVNKGVNLDNGTTGQEPLNLSIYRSNTLNEIKYAAALEAVSHERELLRKQVNELRQRAEAAEERSEAAHERYHDSIKNMTRLLEDKREPPQRKRFLGIF